MFYLVFQNIFKDLEKFNFINDHNNEEEENYNISVSTFLWQKYYQETLVY